jgi:Amt family ammonium transporter
MIAAKTAGYPFLITTTAAAASAGFLCCCLIEWSQDGKPTAVGAATGAAALEGINPAAGFVYLPQSILIGSLAAAGCLIAVRVKAFIQFVDALDTFIVHGVAGAIGALLTGILASKTVVPADCFPQDATIFEQSANFGLFHQPVQGCARKLWLRGLVHRHHSFGSWSRDAPARQQRTGRAES